MSIIVAHVDVFVYNEGIKDSWGVREPYYLNLTYLTREFGSSIKEDRPQANPFLQ